MPLELLATSSQFEPFLVTLFPWVEPSGTSCPELLPGARATLNGHPLVVRERGNVTLRTFRYVCIPPSFELSDRALVPEARGDVVSTLEIEDGTHTVHMEVKGLGVPRTGRIVEPASGVLTAGAEAVIEWQPTTDVLQPSEVSLDVGQRTLRGEALHIEGNRIRFTLPGDTPRGQLYLSVSAGNSGPIVSCNTPCALVEGVLRLDTEVR
jgi:hypothetical protein